MPGARKAGRGSAGGRAVAATAGGAGAAGGVDARVEPLTRLLPGEPAATEVARGLKGFIVAETEIGDVRGLEGFYHYRQYSAVELAEKRTIEDVWHLMFEGHLPDRAEQRAFADEIRPLRHLPANVAEILPVLAAGDSFSPLNALRTAVSHLTA